MFKAYYTISPNGRKKIFYFLSSLIGLVLIVMIIMSITISPVPDEVNKVNYESYENIPPMYDINWGSEAELLPEERRAIFTFYVCEYTPRGKDAMQSMLNLIGRFNFAEEDRRGERANEIYGLAKQYEQDGVCRWSEHIGYVFGSIHSRPEYDLSQVPHTKLPNGISAYIQPLQSEWEDEVVYSLFTDIDDAVLEKELFAGDQWALIN